MPGARQAFRFNPPSKPDDGFRIMSRLLALVVAACLAAPLMASAQLASSDAAIKHRQAAFTLMATYFARINSVVKGERPFNRPSVAADAQLVETLSRLLWVGFAPGSDSGKTKAKPDIWLEEEKFVRLGDDMQAKVSALRVSTQDGDLSKVKLAFEQARDSCQACHKAFRSD